MFYKQWTFIGGATAAILAAVYVFWGPSKSRRKKGFPGLHNFGNTCFLNVILQSWASCPSLLRWLNSQCTVQHQAMGSLTSAVLKVLKVLNNSSDVDPQVDVYSPGVVLHALERRGWVISPGQQDCHELMHAMSETLDEETSRFPTVLSLFDVKGLQDSKNKYQPQASARTRSTGLLPVLPGRQNSPLHGLLASQAKCLRCGHRCPVKYDLFDSLSLTLPQISCWTGLSLESLLYQYVKPEVIENANCPHCAKRQSANKETTKPSIQRILTIGKVPQCLCLHIQRLQINSSGMPIKRQDHVTFPETLFMDPYLFTKSGAQDFTKSGLCGGNVPSIYRTSAPVNLLRTLNFDASTARNGLFLQMPASLTIPPSMADVNHNSPTSPLDISAICTGSSLETASTYCYRLTAVVSHFGDVMSGHFVTYRRGPMSSTHQIQQPQMSESWWYASDCTVEKVSISQVLSSQAYMLFYERV
ncbi:hypothetical protein C0Q70_03668 [Pomacea canaliculata]|uniref:Ubiquitin carboxyl-terminal hydrolase n=1 Tax=Pomacea canaliculata TaxID=400727 RepID=A0A2T7PTD1_POMCA|nr:ubiquitin carboxyl-terminal hydrolase 30-like [Pomacea canaliculata]PVD36682.1 hypothetical protein C0Q70_03668 [Pomacea canaliculata]